MRDCEHKQSLCGCIDWKRDDIALLVNHLMKYFEFTGFELEYASLEQPESCRLCKVGRCRFCGKRLCIGGKLSTQGTSDELLSGVFRRAFQMWNAGDKNLPDGAECFTDLFVSLFHEADRERVNKWLAHHGADTGEGT